MSTTELLKPVLTGGIHNTNFFNGRILTAEDLNTEQDANRKQRNRLGRAIGDGIVYGLKVGVVEEQTLYVTPGLALNRLGQSLCIPEEGLSDGKIKIPLVPKMESVTGTSNPFFDCTTKSESKDSVLSSTGEGIYILVMSPASEYEGRAPMVGLNDDSSITSCGKKYFVEGIQFRLVKLDISSENINVRVRRELLSLLRKSNTANISLLRNILAHLCFGTEEIFSFVQDPFNRDKSSGMSPYVSYGLLDSLRSLKIPMLTDSDVPLALVFWISNEIKVDIWSVRRSLVTRPTTELWPLPLSNRRLVEAEACFQQFQEQIESIYSSTNDNELAEINAEDYFRYLPAAGIIPISTNYLLYSDCLKGIPRLVKGFNPENFFKKYFADMSIRKPVVIEGSNLGAIINSSLYYPPIHLKSRELIWLYLIRENLESIAKGSSNSPQPYMIFTTGQIQYQGDARYNLNRWNYSNYSKVED